MIWGWRFQGLFGAACLLAGCTGEISGSLGPSPSGASGGAGASPIGGAPNVPVTCAPMTKRRVRRLSQAEYGNVVTELFGATPSLLGWSAPDTLVHGFDTNADALTISSGNFDDFASAAELLAARADVTALAPCLAAEGAEACAARFAASFGQRAFGRDLTSDEQSRLRGVYADGAAPGGFAGGVRLVIEALLLSPYFLYRSELGTGLSDAEAASALSFSLTGSRPDAELRERARQPGFTTSPSFRSEAERLVATPAAQQHLTRFLRGWLGLQSLQEVTKIPAYYPAFTPALRDDMDREISSYLADAFARGGTLEAVLGGERGFPSAGELSAIYALDFAPGAMPASSAAGLVFEPRFRRGVISLPGWLAARSAVHRSSPVDRGLAIRSRFFCQSFAAPPANALASAPSQGDATATTRQKFERHATDPSCRACHAQFDPIGFGLEMMDAIGRRRETENALAVDSSGMLSGTDVDGVFSGPGELAQKLMSSQQVRACFTLQMFRFLEGRDETPSDACRIERMREAFGAGSSIARLAVASVLDPAGLERSVEP